MKNKIIFHGSPCQDFSLAGKQAGGDKDSGTRSSLLYETVRIVEKTKPKYVIWENVKNVISKKHKHTFDNYLHEMELLGYTNYYQVLNAKDYGIPQNRERVFTVSILGNEKYEFPKGEECDNSIKVVGNYMPSRHDASRIVDENGIAPTVKENHGTVTAVLQRFEFPPKQELTLKLKDMLEDEVDEKYYLSKEIINKITINRENENCIQWDRIGGELEMWSRAWKNISPTVNTKCQNTKIVIKEATKQGYKEACEGDEINISSRMKYQRGNVQKESIQTITTSGGSDRGIVLNDLRIRKLTPKECWRLMGFDDVDFEKASQVCSNSQLYKQAGNSIVVNVLEALFNSLLDKKEEYELIELFGGIGSPRKALQKQKFNFKTIDYVEIDKYAVKSYNAIFNENYEPKDIKNS